MYKSSINQDRFIECVNNKNVQCRIKIFDQVQAVVYYQDNNGARISTEVPGEFCIGSKEEYISCKSVNMYWFEMDWMAFFDNFWSKELSDWIKKIGNGCEISDIKVRVHISSISLFFGG